MEPEPRNVEEPLGLSMLQHGSGTGTYGLLHEGILIGGPMEEGVLI